MERILRRKPKIHANAAVCSINQRHCYDQSWMTWKIFAAILISKHYKLNIWENIGYIRYDVVIITVRIMHNCVFSATVTWWGG